MGKKKNGKNGGHVTLAKPAENTLIGDAAKLMQVTHKVIKLNEGRLHTATHIPTSNAVTVVCSIPDREQIKVSLLLATLGSPENYHYHVAEVLKLNL